MERKWMIIGFVLVITAMISRTINNLIIDDDKPIHVNARGKIMTLPRSLFNSETSPNNSFKKMFTGEIPSYQTPTKHFDDPVYFIDCNPVIFEHILDWLKFGLIDKDLNVSVNKLIITAMQFGIDLRLPILQNSNIVGKDFSQVDFSGMLLENLNFRASSFVRCNFRDTVLVNVDFGGCDFTNSTFYNSKIENVIVKGAKFDNVVFKDCLLIQTHLNSFSNPRFIDCHLTSSDIEKFEFKEIEDIISNNLVTNCTFKGSELEKLQDLSKFKGNTFDTCLFNFKEFKNEVIQSIRFKRIDLKGFDWKDFKISNTFFSQCMSVPSIPLDTNIIYSNLPKLNLYSLTKSKSIPGLLYRASRDGLTPEAFHSKCDNQGPTLTIIQTDRQIIVGAFTTQSWQSPQSARFVSDDSAFIFKAKFVYNDMELEISNIKHDRREHAIYVDKNGLPSFGDHDIYISSDYSKSSFKLGSTYALPLEGLPFGAFESLYFNIRELEVFKIDY